MMRVFRQPAALALFALAVTLTAGWVGVLIWGGLWAVRLLLD